MSIEDINLKEKIKDKGEVTLQDEGEELWRWVSIEDINLKEKIKDKGERLLCKMKEKSYGDG